MRILIILTITFMALSLNPGVTLAKDDDKDRRNAARELLVVTESGKMAELILGQMLPRFQQQLPDVPKEFWNEIVESVDGDEIIELVVPIYAKHLSAKDMRSISKFYKSKAGKNFISIQGALTQESMTAGQVWGGELAQKIIIKLKKEGHIKEPPPAKE